MNERILHSVPAPQAADDPLMRDVVGTVLRRARLAQGRTLREVAEAAQVSMPYLSEIERGRKEPSSEVLAAVYRALDLRLIDLVGELRTELAPQPAPRSTSGPQAMMLAA